VGQKIATAWVSLRNLWAARPFLDQLAPAAALIIWALLGCWTPNDDTITRNGLTVLATISGMAMAATTFACSMTYQSANILMARVKTVFAGELKRNWITIIRSNLLTAVVPLVGLMVSAEMMTVAVGLGVYAASLLVCRFLRATFWLQFTLFMQESSYAIPEKVAVHERADLA
jgi:hypothetical protein